MKLGIFGLGNMGYALISSILNNKLLSKTNIAYNDISNKKKIAEQLSIPFKEIEDLCDFSDLIIIAVKPKDIKFLLSNIKDKVYNKIILSICAGISVSFIEAIIGFDSKIVRVMPNTPLLVGEGASCISYSKGFSHDEKSFIVKILKTLGMVIEINENLMDAVTGLSASGPAYVFLFIEALADGGVRAGLPRDTALALAGQVVLGAAKLFIESKAHPAELKDMITSPAGTTIEGISILEKNAFRGSVIEAVYQGAIKASRITEEELKRVKK